MIDVISLVKKILDEDLRSIPLHVFWLQRQDVFDDTNPDEYVVYTVDEHEPEDGADGGELIYRSYVTIRYFCRENWPGDYGMYAVIRKRLDLIRHIMTKNDFACSGWQNVGDVDGISYITFVLTAEYAEAERGDDEPD